MAILNNSNAISSGGYDINNSLRFRSSASAYLSRTPASSGNRQVWTWSAWIKRGTLGGASNVLFNCYNTASSTQTSIEFANDTLGVFSNDSSTVNLNLFTTQVFRDPSAWYHFVVTVDTTQATSSNRVKIYVNGSQITAFSTSTYPSLNYNSHINTTSLHTTFATRTPSGLTDGYLAENNFVDGSAKTPSDFGETDTTTGSWKPKAYTGTYGTNGFYLKFSDIATTSGSNAGLGKDFSGNANYWTTNNISVTAGTTYDAMIDSPTLTSATVANYCVLNPINLSTSSSTSNANLRFTNSNGGQSWRSVGSTIAPTSGKWYWEGVFSGASGSGGGGIFGMVGVFNPNNYFITNYTASLFVDIGYGYYGDDGNKKILGATTSYGATFTNGDIIGLALDLDSGTLTCYKNNVSQGVLVSGLSGPLTPAFAIYDNNATVTANFGQRPFTYTPPTGFVRLNTYNLPDSTIKKGNTVMDATTYTGTGASLSVTNTGAFKPDFVWVKGRSGATDHALYDSVRGTTKDLVSNSTAAETTQAQGLTAFGTGGFTVGTLAKMNTSAATYVGWQWQAGQGSTSSNTSGSITSTVSVNTTAGFSILTYTGNGSAGATIGHSLGLAPSWVIVKRRNSSGDDWLHYHTSLGATKSIAFDTGAAITSSTRWNNTTPSSTLITLGTSTGVNGSGATYVAYCWAEIAGFSNFGSYTGNGSTDGPFVYTGFRPKYIMHKRTDTTSDWIVLDTSRDTYNYSDKELYPNLTNAEGVGGATNAHDILSNGFKLRSANAQSNASGGTYIYMAFAENPFKNSNAR